MIPTRFVILTAVIGIAVHLHTANADDVTHFGDGPFGDVGTLLDSVGIGSGNVASETTAESFIVPGTAGDSVDLEFTFERDTGAFLFTFGFYPVASVTADPIADKKGFATEALTAGTVVFEDALVSPGATSTHTVTAGTELGFFIVPDDSVAAVLADVDSFYDPPANMAGGPRSPLFSNTDANPGELDQLLSFVASGVTLFTFEDLTRIGASDEDFTDIAFTIDAELMPVPEPTSVVVLLVSSLAAIMAGRFRSQR